MSILNVREISTMINRCPKAIHKQIRLGRLKAEKESPSITSPYIVKTIDFAKYLCETPLVRKEFNRYMFAAKKNGNVTCNLLEIVGYVQANPDWFVYSASELARVLDVTQQSIHNWTRKGYLEEDFGPGLYSRKSVLALAKNHPRFDKFMPKGGIPT